MAISGDLRVGGKFGGTQFVGFDKAKQKPAVFPKNQPAKSAKHVVAQRFPAFLQQRVQNRGFDEEHREFRGNAELRLSQNRGIYGLEVEKNGLFVVAQNLEYFCVLAVLQKQRVKRKHGAPQVDQRAEIVFHALRQTAKIPADILLNLGKRLRVRERRRKNGGKVLLDLAGNGGGCPREESDLAEEKAANLIVQTASTKRLHTFFDTSHLQ